jgi:tetratricopeptide (TPR) repeat protein/DNA-binding winged helix-turn-helix (wHTH) protein
MAPQLYRIRDANLEVRPDLGGLRRDGEEIYLRPKTFQTLLFLLDQRHRVVTKDEIAAEIWPDAAVTDDTIVQCIVEIRKLLGDDAKQAKYVRTFAKAGYRFVGAVDVVEPEELVSDSDAVVSTSPAPEAETPSQLPKHQRSVTIALVLAVALISTIGGVWYVQSTRSKAAEDLRERLAEDAAHRPAIGVMFLDNQSKTAELDWLREGLADMLVSGLSRSDGISVVGRQQLELLLERAGHARGTPIDLAAAVDIAGRAHLDHIVLGSFAKLGNTIRIDLRLHDAAGALVKTESLTIDNPDDLLRQVDLLSWRLAQHFGEVSPAAPSSSPAMTTNLEAYRYYSLGLSRAGAFRNAEAVEFFEKAIELDPEFAMAYGRIGYAYGVIGTDLQKAQPFLAKAYSLGHRLSHKDRLQVEAWNALVHLDYASAVTSFSEIVRTYPMEVEAYARLGLLLSGERRYDESLEVFKRGLAVDPDSADLWNRIGGVYSEMGRVQDAISAREKYVALQPSEANAYDSLGHTYHMGGLYDQAVTAYQRALQLDPRFGLAKIHLGNTYVHTGQYNEAIAAFGQYLAGASSDFDIRRAHRSLAIVALRRGDLENALRSARKAGAGQPLTIVEARIRIAMGEPPDRISALLHPPPPAPNRGSRGGERPWSAIQGLLALKRGEGDRAIEHFREAIQDRPTAADPETLEDVLANAYLELGRYDEAIAEFERVLKINPRFPLAHYGLGRAYEGKRQSESARKSYEQFLTVWARADRDIPEVVNAQARLAALK